ncbi:MAG TPA: hypothetical protein VI074_01430 [Propionibacteriaceae bacterium]|jgi:hypothetical protein
MAVSVDLGSALDQSVRKQEPQERLAAPRPRRRASLSATIRCSPTSSGIQTVAEVGSNKDFALAGALVALGNKI